MSKAWFVSAEVIVVPFDPSPAIAHLICDLISVPSLSLSGSTASSGEDLVAPAFVVTQIGLPPVALVVVTSPSVAERFTGFQSLRC